VLLHPRYQKAKMRNNQGIPGETQSSRERERGKGVVLLTMFYYQRNWKYCVGSKRLFVCLEKRDNKRDASFCFRQNLSGITLSDRWSLHVDTEESR
jgi:hypothetical protein